MATKIEGKKAIVAELVDIANRSVSAIAADYRGLDASEMTKLRKLSRDAGVHMKIYRNTLARRAVEGTAFACLNDTLVGPIVLLFSIEEPGAAAKLLRDFVKEHKKIEVRALALGGQLLGADQLKAIASLPSREEALAMLLSVMKAPVTKFVRTLREPYAQMVRVMGAIRDKQQAA